MEISEQNQAHRDRQHWAREASKGEHFRYVRTVVVLGGPLNPDGTPGLVERQVPATYRSPRREAKRAAKAGRR